MGPGLALKVIGGKRFSVLAFGLSQVAIDIEPLIGLLRGASTLQGWTHTFVGATAIGLAVAVVSAPPCRAILRMWNRVLEESGFARLQSAATPRSGALFAGALLGAWTHVLLDGVMHADLHPFAPWSQEQPWWRLIDIGWLHLGCVLAGVAGLMGLWLRVWMQGRDRGRGSPRPE